MIKFFRNIRKNLLKQAKVRSYFFYALGEIILVVIGILIALQINNWNTNRSQKNKESVYINNIKRDLIEQLASIEKQLEYEDHINSVASPIIDYYKKYQDFEIDSAFTANIGLLTGRKTFVKIEPTYMELISTGNLDIIRYDTLKNRIINYYQELERIELIINKNNNLYVDAVFIPEMIRLSEIQVSSELKNDYLLGYIPNEAINIIDLNEKRLKEIMGIQLNNPENELRMINNINFRNYISVIHYDILLKHKSRTQNLLETISAYD